jgi:hypothetical protein
LAASAAPAAICCFFDFAGITKVFRSRRAKRFCLPLRRSEPDWL